MFLNFRMIATAKSRLWFDSDFPASLFTLCICTEVGRKRFHLDISTTVRKLWVVEAIRANLVSILLFFDEVANIWDNMHILALVRFKVVHARSIGKILGSGSRSDPRLRLPGNAGCAFFTSWSMKSNGWCRLNCRSTGCVVRFHYAFGPFEHSATRSHHTGLTISFRRTYLGWSIPSEVMTRQRTFLMATRPIPPDSTLPSLLLPSCWAEVMV